MSAAHRTPEPLLLPDLFWEPCIGDFVLLRPSARTGVAPFDKHPLRVKRADEVGGQRIFSCETTGPVEQRTTKTGRTFETCPCWTGFYIAEQLVPTANTTGSAA